MARKRPKKSKPKPKAGARVAEPQKTEFTIPAWAIFLWALAVQWVYLRDGSVTGFFFGDGLYYLQKARHLAEGTSLDADLPFHPPLASWILVPLWWLAPAQVVLGAKTLMALLNAATYALIYRLLRPRVPLAAAACLLMPLGFGELMLTATPTSEVPYRLLLVTLLTLGGRWPVLGGVLHALAALTRAEHVVLGLGLLALGLLVPARRRFALVTAATAFVCLLPYTIATAIDLRAYNERHAAELPEPLPTVVPISFYGPLNFALAQTEDGIHFSRRKLPVAAGDAAALDPRDPAHNRYVVHGYRVGLEAIRDDPGRFVSRTTAKLGHSFRAFTQGFTWRDLPKGDTWTRRPVDMAHASQPVYEVVVGVLTALGVFALRRHRWLLGLAVALLVYRLALAVAFFPYLRSMMIVAPLLTLFLVAGVSVLARRYASRVLALLIVALALFHFATGFDERGYRQAGERDARGAVIDDRTVLLKYDG